MRKLPCPTVLLLTLLCSASMAQQLKTIALTDTIFMLQGIGGNIGVAIGEQPFVIDNQLPFASKKVIAAVGELTEQPIAFVINTHFHSDHIGGNPAMKQLGAIIVSHNNARTRMTKESISVISGKQNPPAKPEAWPVLTFSRAVNFHINGQHIAIRHIENAHTDGDAIVHFADANVIHAGDVFLQGSYPIIDYHAGGSLDGVIAAADILIAMADNKTKIIPGHGNLSTVDDVKAFKALCQTIKQRVAAGIESGKSLEDQLADQPLADLEAQWGNKFMPGRKAFKMIFEGESARRLAR